MIKYAELKPGIEDDGRPIFVHLHNWGQGWIFTELSFTGRRTPASHVVQPEYKVIDLNDCIAQYADSKKMIALQIQKSERSFVGGVVAEWANDRANS